MTFQPGAVVYTQSFGSRSENVEVPEIQTRPPNGTDVKFPIGKRWVDTTAGNEYVLGNFTTVTGVLVANWAFLGSTTGDLNSLTTQDLTVVTPTSGNIDIDGNNTQGVSTTGSNSPGTVTITVADATTTQKGVMETSTTAEAIAGSSTSVAVTPAALQAKIGVQTAHGVGLGNTGATSALSWTAEGATGTVLAGTTGADPSFTGSPSVSGSLTAGTTITATSGNITATNGNLAAATAGRGLVLTAVTGTGAASGPVVCNARLGVVTFTSVSIAAAADLTLTISNNLIVGSTSVVLPSLAGATTGSALTIKSVTNSAGSCAIVVTNGTGATTTTENIVITFLLLN